MFLIPNILAVAMIVFGATIFRSAFGFGESLVAVPLLALFVPVSLAVPLSVLVSVTIAAFVVVQDHKRIHIKSAGGLIIYALMGIPLGLWLLMNLEGYWIKIGLGVIITFFAIFQLRGNRLKTLREDDRWWLFGCGFLSGILGGAYGINGPPLVVYGAKREWNAQHFRATLQAYFLIASMAGIIGYWWNGLLSPLLFHYFFLTLPAVIPGILLGRMINSKISGSQFFMYSYAVLLGLGLLLICITMLQLHEGIARPRLLNGN
jgi:uncharacterized protein